jgi:hypothetical protein
MAAIRPPRRKDGALSYAVTWRLGGTRDGRPADRDPAHPAGRARLQRRRRGRRAPLATGLDEGRRLRPRCGRASRTGRSPIRWPSSAASSYSAALHHAVAHPLEHATFLDTAVLFWRAVADLRHSSPGFGVLFVFAAGMQSVFLSLLITFAESPWYPGYATTTAAWGHDPLRRPAARWRPHVGSRRRGVRRHRARAVRDLAP